MAKKILKGAGGLLGIGKKKKAAPAVEAGPKITPLEPDVKRPKRTISRQLLGASKDVTLLSDKLG